MFSTYSRRQALGINITGFFSGQTLFLSSNRVKALKETKTPPPQKKLFFIMLHTGNLKN